MAFNEYLHRFGIIASPECAHCKAPVNDVAYTLFECQSSGELRMAITGMLGRTVGAVNVEDLLCGAESVNPADWTTRRLIFLDMIENIMEVKEQDERVRQRIPV